MRPISHFVVAFITVLWRSAVSTVTFGNQTNFGLLASPTVPSRPAKTTSINPMLVKAHDYTIEDTDPSDQRSEERAISLPGGKNAVYKLEDGMWDVMRSTMAGLHSSDKQSTIEYPAAKKLTDKLEQTYQHMELNNIVKWGKIIDQEKFVQSLSDNFSILHYSTIYKRLVEYLTEPVRTIMGIINPRVRLQDLVTAFHLLRDVRGMEEYAEKMQRELAVTHPKTVELMIPLWLKSELDPNVVFDMMPIAAEELSARGVANPDIWSRISGSLKQWFEYVNAFNRQHGTAPIGKILEAWPTGFYKSPANSLYRQVREDRDVKDLVPFIEYLRDDKDLQSFSRAIQQELLVYPSSEAEAPMFTLWVEKHVNPQDVYRSMPVASTKRLGVEDKLNQRADFHKELAQWMRYVDVYREYFGDGDLDYTKMFELLQSTIGDRHELGGLLKEFKKTFPDMNEHTDRLLDVYNST